MGSTSLKSPGARPSRCGRAEGAWMRRSRNNQPEATAPSVSGTCSSANCQTSIRVNCMASSTPG